MAVDTSDGTSREFVVCTKCGIPYVVWIRQNRQTRSRKSGDKNSPARAYNMRVYLPDGREELIQFENGADQVFVDVKSRDPLVFVFGPFGLSEASVRLHVNGQPSSIQRVIEDYPIQVALTNAYKEGRRFRRGFKPLPEVSPKAEQLMKAPHLWTLVALKNVATNQQGALEAPQPQNSALTRG